MSIEDIVVARRISEVVHFTTSHGCLGTLYTKNLLSRARLQNDEMVRYLFAANAELRRDVSFLDYISLSLEHINTEFYRVSANKWHRNDPIFWCILAFDPVVLTHDGVVFATTNNIYSSVIRSAGETGLKRLFADRVERWNSTPIVRRTTDMNDCYPTCFQAEALYPQALSTDYLQRIYVRTARDQSETIGFLKATFHPEINVIIAPEKFEDRPV